MDRKQGYRIFKGTYMDNEKMAELIAKKLYSIPETKTDFAFQLFVEEMVLPKDKTGYTEEEMKDFILAALDK